MGLGFKYLNWIDRAAHFANGCPWFGVNKQEYNLTEIIELLTICNILALCNGLIRLSDYLNKRVRVSCNSSNKTEVEKCRE